MIDLSLAIALREAGFTWDPRPGDRFTLTAPEMVDDVFHVADMVVEVKKHGSGTFFAFNGTTEWALDSVEEDKTVWLPGEMHLRTALGSAFRLLSADENGFIVTATVDGREHCFEAEDVENAYGRALLALLSND